MKSPTLSQDLKNAFRSTFLAPNGTMSDAQKKVLAAICQKCGGGLDLTQTGPDGRVDADATLIAVGSARVWTYIVQMLALSDEDVARLAAYRTMPPQ